MADQSSFAVLPDEQQALLKAVSVFPGSFSVYGAAHMLAGHQDTPPEMPPCAPRATTLIEAPTRYVDDAQRIINDLCAADLVQLATEIPALPKPVPADVIPANGRRAFKLQSDVRLQAQQAAGSNLSAYQQVYKDHILIQLNTWALRYTECGCIKALQMAMVLSEDTAEVMRLLALPQSAAQAMRDGHLLLGKIESLRALLQMAETLPGAKAVCAAMMAALEPSEARRGAGASTSVSRAQAADTSAGGDQASAASPKGDDDDDDDDFTRMTRFATVFKRLQGHVKTAARRRRQRERAQAAAAQAPEAWPPQDVASTDTGAVAAAALAAPAIPAGLSAAQAEERQRQLFVAALHYLRAWILLSDESFDAGELAARKAHEARVQLLGSRHPDTLAAFNIVALCASGLDNYARGERMLRHVLAERRAVLGESHWQTAASLGNLASCLLHLERPSMRQCRYAEQLSEVALRFFRQRMSTDALQYTTAQWDLAMSYDLQRRLPRAEGLMRHVTSQLRTSLGPYHLQYINAVCNLGSLIMQQGDHRAGEAQVHVSEALAAYEATVGHDHPHTARTLQFLADLQAAQGYHAQAEELHAEAVSIFSTLHGPFHTLTAGAVVRLANALVVQERHAEALQLLDQALALYTGAAGARSKAAAEALTHYARALANLGMEHLAMPHAERAFNIFQELYRSGVVSRLDHQWFHSAELYAGLLTFGGYPVPRALSRRLDEMERTGMGMAADYYATDGHEAAGLGEGEGEGDQQRRAGAGADDGSLDNDEVYTDGEEDEEGEYEEDGEEDVDGEEDEPVPARSRPHMGTSTSGSSAAQRGTAAGRSGAGAGAGTARRNAALSGSAASLSSAREQLVSMRDMMQALMGAFPGMPGAGGAGASSSTARTTRVAQSAASQQRSEAGSRAAAGQRRAAATAASVREPDSDDEDSDADDAGADELPGMDALMQTMRQAMQTAGAAQASASTAARSAAAGRARAASGSAAAAPMGQAAASGTSAGTSLVAGAGSVGGIATPSLPSRSGTAAASTLPARPGTAKAAGASLPQMKATKAGSTAARAASASAPAPAPAARTGTSSAVAGKASAAKTASSGVQAPVAEAGDRASDVPEEGVSSTAAGAESSSAGDVAARASGSGAGAGTGGGRRKVVARPVVQRHAARGQQQQQQAGQQQQQQQGQGRCLVM